MIATQLVSLKDIIMPVNNINCTMGDKILLLHSDKSNSNVYTLDKRIQGIYRFKSFVSTNNMYNVNDTNNKIYFNETVGLGTNDYIATLTNGYYDANDLNTNISTAISNQASGIITVSYDDNTSKYTITNTNEFHFTFGSNTSNSAHKLLGFNASDGTDSLSQTSDVPIDLNPCKNIFVTITEDDNRYVEGIDFFNCSLVVNGVSGFGEIMRYIDVDNFIQLLKFKNTKQLSVSFHDANNNIIDLNSEYQIILQKIQS